MQLRLLSPQRNECCNATMESIAYIDGGGHELPDALNHVGGQCRQEPTLAAAKCIVAEQVDTQLVTAGA